MNAKTEYEFKKKWLQWILDFVQLDLNSVSKSRFRGLCANLFYFCSAAFTWGTFEAFLSSICFDKLPEIQVDNSDEIVLRELRKQDHPETSAEEAEKMISEIGPKLLNIQKALKGFLEETKERLIKPITITSPETGKEYRGYEVALPETENRLDIKRTGRGFSWHMVSVPRNYSQKDWGILNLAKLIDGIDINAVRRCEGCGRYFLNVSAREKIYCNFACASRSIAHKKYEELKKDPKKYEAHLRRYRKLSSQRYKRLRQLQYGPNVRIQTRRNIRKGG